MGLLKGWAERERGRGGKDGFLAVFLTERGRGGEREMERDFEKREREREREREKEREFKKCALDFFSFISPHSTTAHKQISTPQHCIS
jgi:MoaA/NifB/PqqE/SkfB family radical SAM enzyme